MAKAKLPAASGPSTVSRITTRSQAVGRWIVYKYNAINSPPLGGNATASFSSFTQTFPRERKQALNIDGATGLCSPTAKTSTATPGCRCWRPRTHPAQQQEHRAQLFAAVVHLALGKKRGHGREQPVPVVEFLPAGRHAGVEKMLAPLGLFSINPRLMAGAGACFTFRSEAAGARPTPLRRKNKLCFRTSAN